MNFSVNIQKLEGVPPGQIYSVKWRKKSPPLEGRSLEIESTDTGVAPFQYTFNLKIDAKRQADGSWEEINDVSISIIHHLPDGEKKSLHKLGLLLNMFIDQANSSVLVRHIGTMRLYLAVTFGYVGGESIPQGLPQVPQAPPPVGPPISRDGNQIDEVISLDHIGRGSRDQDRIIILRREIEAAERAITAIDQDVSDTREALLNAKQASLMKAVALSRSSSQLTKYLTNIKRKEDLQDTKDIVTGLRLELTATQDQISVKEVLTEKAKNRIRELDKQTLEVEQELKERKLQNRINETATADSLVIMERAMDKGSQIKCLVS